MKWKKIRYGDLNAKEKESYNLQKISSLLAEYGFVCMKLTEDYRSADFLAIHKDGEILRVQLKPRLCIGKKYVGKNLWIAFPVGKDWYLVEHDRLVKLIGKYTGWLRTRSWIEHGGYSAAGMPKDLNLDRWRLE